MSWANYRVQEELYVNREDRKISHIVLSEGTNFFTPLCFTTPISKTDPSVLYSTSIGEPKFRICKTCSRMFGKQHREFRSEGNSGGDYLWFEILPDGRVHFKMGHCCVVYVDIVAPTEVLTEFFAEAIDESGKSFAQAWYEKSGWQEETVERLAGQIESPPGYSFKKGK